MEYRRISFEVPVKEHIKIKIEAARRDMSIKDFLIKSYRWVIEEQRKAEIIEFPKKDY